MQLFVLGDIRLDASIARQSAMTMEWIELHMSKLDGTGSVMGMLRWLSDISIHMHMHMSIPFLCT